MTDVTAYNARGDLPGLTVDTVVYQDGEQFLTARRTINDRGPNPQPVWVVRVDLDLGERRRYDTAGRFDPIAADGQVRLEGCGDDLAAVHAGLKVIAAALASFADRLHVARLSVLGELGDASKIAQADRRRRDDALEAARSGGA